MVDEARRGRDVREAVHLLGLADLRLRDVVVEVVLMEVFCGVRRRFVRNGFAWGRWLLDGHPAA